MTWRGTCDGIVMNGRAYPFIALLDYLIMCLNVGLSFIYTLDFHLELFQPIDRVSNLGQSREISDHLLEVGPAGKVSSPEVLKMKSVVWEKVFRVNRPVLLELQSLCSCSPKIFIYWAVGEVESPSLSVTFKCRSRILPELILNVSEHPREIHASRDHDVICSEVIGVPFKTLKVDFRVGLDWQVLLCELCLYLRFLCVSCVLSESTGCIIKFMHNMCKDTVVTRLGSTKSFKCGPPNKF